MSSDSPQTIQGVRISCDADIDLLKAKKFIPVLADRSAPMFKESITFHGDLIAKGPVSSHPVSPLSELVGIPLEIRKIAPDSSWKDGGRYTNQAATFLLIDVNPESTHWGFAPLKWQNRVGSVLVTRIDGGKVSAQQVEALCAYNKELLVGPISMASESGKKKNRMKAADEITPSAFKAFFEKFEKQKLGEDPAWGEEVTPTLMESRESAWGPGSDFKPVVPCLPEIFG